MTTAAKVGLFVPLNANPDQASALESLLLQGQALSLNEEGTLQWFAAKYTHKLVPVNLTPADPLDTQYLIFDTFEADTGRQTHLNGPIAAALMGKKDELLSAQEGVAIKPIQLIAHKIKKPASASGVTQSLKTGVRVLFTAKPDKKEAVRKHLAFIGERAHNSITPVWFGFEIVGTNQFGIFALWESKEDQDTILNNPAARGIRENEPEGGLYESPPEVVQLQVVGAKI